MQLNNLAIYHKKTTYNLLSPFLRRIALAVGSAIDAKASLLPEICRLLSISPADFWTRTLSLSLPHFVLTRNKVLLTRIAGELSTTLSHLLLQSTHSILSHIFLQQDTAATDRALSFFIEILQDAAPGNERASINLTVVTKSCIVPLLADLVIALGAEYLPSRDVVRVLKSRRVTTRLNEIARQVTLW